ncbi:MAG: hypothetical protein KC457_29735, partial [Myxococcales bacterium]|nr:hypothetical protein [Myxococcales bacterium]
MSDDLDFMPATPAQDKDDADQASKADKSTAKADKTGDKSADKAEGERAELPTWNRSRRKRKANVKAEAEDDAFKRGVRQASRQVIDTPKLVIGAIVIVVAAIAGGVLISNNRAEANTEATHTIAGATASIVRGQVVEPEKQEGLVTRNPLYATEDEREAAIVEALAAAKDSGREQVAIDAQLLEAAH